MAGSLTAANDSNCLRPDVLRFITKSATTTREADIRDYLDPLADYIESNTNINVVIYGREKSEQIYSDIIKQRFEIAIVDPKSYAKAKRIQPAIEIFATFHLKDPQGNSGKFQSILITHKNSGLKDPNSLEKRIMALVDPGSTSGYLFPRQHYPLPEGHSFETFFGKILYSGKHSKSIKAVENQSVDAAFVASIAFDGMSSRGLINAGDYST